MRSCTNYIYLIEMAGLRIGHFGDIGQEAFTSDQLDVLGDIDIAITQFDNRYSQMTVQNMKGFVLMEQINPKLIIPTHTSREASEQLSKKWASIFTEQPSATIAGSTLPGTTSILFMGTLAGSYGTLFDIPKSVW